MLSAHRSINIFFFALANILKLFTNASKMSSNMPEMQTGTVTQQMVKIRYGGESYCP